MLCRLYKIQVQENNLPPFTTDYINGVQKMRGHNNNQTYDSFVETYGTHYVAATSLGSKYVESFQSTREQTSMLQSSTTTIEAGAEVSALGNAASTDYLNEQQKSEKKSYDELSTKFNMMTLGAEVPQGDSSLELAKNWADNTLASNSLQMVSDYEFAGLDGLFGPDRLEKLNTELKHSGFNAMTSKELKTIQNGIKKAIEYRCERAGFYCTGPTDDIALPKPAEITRLPNDFDKQSFPNGRGGAKYEASSDVGALLGHPGKQTADMHVSKVEFWFKTDSQVVHQGTEFLEGIRVYYKDSQGNERSTPLSGNDSGKKYSIPIEEGKTVGSIDIRTGTHIDYIELKDTKGASLGTAGNEKGGAINVINIKPQERFNGFFGWSEPSKFMYSIGVQRAQLQVFA